MSITARAARDLIDAAHAAWTNRDLERLLSLYHPDIAYACNVEGDDGQPVRFSGREGMRAFLQPALDALDSISVVEHFAFKDGIARASVECALTHRASGYVLTGQYRQVFQFEDGMISILEEYHDAAKLKAFWALVS